MANPPNSDSTLADFGANEWLAEEMRERFDEDPGSVEPAWRTYFEGAAPGSNGAPSEQPARSTTTSTPAAAAAPANGPRVAPPRTPSTTPAATATTPAPAPTKSEAPAAPAAPTKESSPVKQAAPSTPAAAPKPDPAAAGKDAGKDTGKSGGRDSLVSREAPGLKTVGPQTDVTLTPLRGAVARVVTNMEASLEVPTATSARNLPAKLLIDNRTVINNHLARSRGGKVSFTHIIGYAMVQAVKAMPEMNNGYTTVDGKPTLVQPAHINLGLAIDVPKPDGTRQLLVPCIKSAENMTFYEFWSAYEALVRKAGTASSRSRASRAPRSR